MLRVRLDEQFVRVEPVPLRGIVGSVGAVAVKRSGSGFGQVAVPDFVGPLTDVDPLQFVLPRLVEDAQFDLFGVRRKQREIDALAVPGGSPGVGLPRPDGGDR